MDYNAPVAEDLLLWGIVAVVLLLPFLVHAVERNLEAFLLAMGAAAVTASAQWSGHLVREALREPIHITLAVLGAGLAFHYGRRRFDRAFRRVRAALPLPATIFIVVVGLGLLSSVITAIIAALLLVEVVHLLQLHRKQETAITVLACFAIGLGAVLTPVGEPLSTIVTAKLHGDFWMLFRLLGWWILPGVLAIGAFAAVIHPGRDYGALRDVHRNEPLAEVFIRAVKVYVFVAALVLLGTGLLPLVERYFIKLPAPLLYWVNMCSAILDNATLAAAEVGPALSKDQLMAVLLGLLISGGMLIPGNIPNIVAAGHLKITSREWARVGVPVGLALMAAYFAAWWILHGG
jgi:predicted cation transporter